MSLRSLRRHWLGRLAALAVIGAAVVAAAPSGGHATNRGDGHCGPRVQHEMAGHVHHHHAGPVAALTTAGPDGCSHCPVAACQFVAPCAGTTVAVAASGPANDGFAGHTTSAATVWQPAHSLSQQPPTPPPHALL